MFLFAQAVNLRITATILNNLPYDLKLIRDYVSKGAEDDYPKATIEGYDTTDANAGSYHGKGGTEGVVGYLIPYTDQALIVYFGNLKVYNPVLYVYAMNASSIKKWDDIFVHHIKGPKQTSVKVKITIDGTDWPVVVSIYRLLFEG
jgi:hypothetical protein